MSRMPVVAFLAAALGAAVVFPGADAQDGGVQLTLAAKVPNPKAKRPLLRFDGGAPLPDQSVLFLSVARSFESWAGGRLEPTSANSGGSMAQIKERKFSLESPIDGPGLFAVRVDLREELQNPKLIDHFKKNPVNPRSWNFLFSAWGDDLAPSLVSSLEELDVLAQEAGEMVRRYEAATKSEEAWMASLKEITAENAKLLKKCEQSNLRALYPASLNQIHYTIRNLQGNSPYFTFEGGKFAGATSYHADKQKVKTFRDEAFTFENFKRYVSDSVGLAGREFCLWLIKDYRRAGKQLSSDALDALNRMKAHAGIAEFFDRLKALKPELTVEDLALLEKDVRGAKVEAAPKKDEKK